jgi:hypothetical protein
MRRLGNNVRKRLVPVVGVAVCISSQVRGEQVAMPNQRVDLFASASLIVGDLNQGEPSLVETSMKIFSRDPLAQRLRSV